MQKLIAAMSVMLLASCVLTPPPDLFVNAGNTDAVRDKTRIEIDRNRGTKTILGPTASAGGFSGYFLRGWPDDEMVQLYLHLNEDDWRFYDKVWSEGKSFETVEIDRDVGGCYSFGCSLWETVGAILTLEQVRQFSTRGAPIVFGVYGQRGQRDIVVPPSYFGGYYAAWERFTSRSSAKASSARTQQPLPTAAQPPTEAPAVARPTPQVEVPAAAQSGDPCAKYAGRPTESRCRLYVSPDGWQSIPLAGRNADLDTQLRCAPWRSNPTSYEQCISGIR